MSDEIFGPRCFGDPEPAAVIGDGSLTSLLKELGYQKEATALADGTQQEDAATLTTTTASTAAATVPMEEMSYEAPATIAPHTTCDMMEMPSLETSSIHPPPLLQPPAVDGLRGISPRVMMDTLMKERERYDSKVANLILQLQEKDLLLASTVTVLQNYRKEYDALSGKLINAVIQLRQRAKSKEGVIQPLPAVNKLLPLYLEGTSMGGRPGVNSPSSSLDNKDAIRLTAGITRPAAASTATTSSWRSSSSRNAWARPKEAIHRTIKAQFFASSPSSPPSREKPSNPISEVRHLSDIFHTHLVHCDFLHPTIGQVITHLVRL